MKDVFKNPVFYYVLIPLVAALWPLLIWAHYLPAARKNWTGQLKQYEKAQKVITEILELDPDRLDYAGAKNASADFDYATAIEKTASACRIPSTMYKLTSGLIITSGGQKSQTARVALKDVDITQFAKFLSTLQLHWANLQCTRLKVAKTKTSTDSWNIDVDFKYFF